MNYKQNARLKLKVFLFSFYYKHINLLVLPPIKIHNLIENWRQKRNFCFEGNDGSIDVYRIG